MTKPTRKQLQKGYIAPAKPPSPRAIRKMLERDFGQTFKEETMVQTVTGQRYITGARNMFVAFSGTNDSTSWETNEDGGYVAKPLLKDGLTVEKIRAARKMLESYEFPQDTQGLMTATEVLRRVRDRAGKAINITITTEEDVAEMCMMVLARATATNGQEFQARFKIDYAAGEPEALEAQLMRMIESTFRDEERKSNVIFL